MVGSPLGIAQGLVSADELLDIEKVEFGRPIVTEQGKLGHL
jgi:hypothetical protein